MFQIAAVLGYAEQYGLEAVFYLPRCIRASHSPCELIFRLFPSIRVVEFGEPSWREIGSDERGFATFEAIEPIVGGAVVLRGFRQSEKYFPVGGVSVDLVGALGEATVDRLNSSGSGDSRSRKTMFLHVRLGDYLILPHHQIDLVKYWQNCFAAAAEIIPDRRLLIFSDDPDRVRRHFLAFFESVGFAEVVIVEEQGAIEGLYLMSKCDGGAITANSTYSWWGAYLSESRLNGEPIFMPAQWGAGLDAPDIYPSWATKIDTL